MRLRLAGVLVLASGVLLAGCTPSLVPDPEVVWSPEPDHPLEADPYVIAAREAGEARAVAWNTGDFSRERFVSTRTAEEAELSYEGFVADYVTRGLPPIVLPGPPLWSPISVERDPDGAGADVTVCNASDLWYRDESHEPEIVETGVTVVYRMEGAVNGPILLAGTTIGSRCDATAAPVGRFDPEPELPESISGGDVRPPPSP